MKQWTKVSTDTFVSGVRQECQGRRGDGPHAAGDHAAGWEVQESNFHQQPLMRRKQIHSIEVYWINEWG